MAGYIGANTSSVTNNQNAAERRKKFTFTANTTALTGLSFLPNKIHIFHNGIRLVRNTDYTEASDGQSVTLTNAAQAGDEIVAVTFDQNPATGGGSSYTDADVDAHLLTAGVTLDATNDKLSIGTGATLDVSAGTLVTPAGHIIQTVKSSISDVSNSTTTTTPAEINSVYRVAITPTSTSSTILWMMNAHLNVGPATFGSFAVYRSINGGAYTSINVDNGREAFRQRGAETDQRQTTIMYYDTPSTTNEVIYTPYWFRHSGGSTFYTNDNGMGSFCMAFEIAG
tara:strand:+ start:4025 stop:4873 length:849 start_codon:yes stop_codon:yes gene_type:complete